jgi:hypothetical protein
MIDIVAFQGWSKNLRLSNGTAELIVTLEVGPRILSYTKNGGFNPLKIYDDQVGTSGESVWRNRGGHRLWLAPETREITYCPDNAPVAWEQLGPLAVRLTPPPESATGFQKQLDVTLAPTGTAVTIVHRVTRLGATPAELALWALTVMTPGGVALLPQPPLGEHPRDLLPNRKLVVWPYTDLGDPRWRFGPRFLRLRQDTARGATKIGLADSLGWCAYAVDGVVFVKRYDWNPAAAYPDGGCNFETFSNAKMLEVESLGPLVRLAPGACLEHTERWELREAPPGLADQPDDALAEFFRSPPSR